MKEAGITGVFNVQTQIDIDHRGTNWPLMCQYYEERGITPVHFPIHDFNEGHLTERLMDAAIALNDMVNNKGLQVYVHCTAGMGRAPASALCYYILFKRLSCWRDPAACDRLIKKYRKVSTPNMRAIGNAISHGAFKTLQNKQTEQYTE